MIHDVDFQILLGNIGKEDFFNHYWGKQYLHIKGNERNHFVPISEQELNTFFGNSRLSYPYITLFSKGKPLNLEEYKNRELGAGTNIVDLDKVFELLQKGYSLTVNSMDRMEPKLSAFCQQLSLELKTKFWTNVYITPANRNGFPQHTDHHDVFALQLSGKKKWTIYQENESPIEIILEEGDLLYLPKDYPHEAHTLNSHSVHFTLGADFATYADLVKQLWKSTTKNKKFSKRLNPNQSHLSKEQVEEIQHLIKELIEEQNLQKGRESIQKVSQFERNLKSNNRFSKWLKIEQLSLEDHLVKNKSSQFEIIGNNKFLELHSGKDKLSLPIFLKETINELLQEKPYQLKELKKGEQEKELMRLAKLLLAADVIEFVN